MRTIKILSLPFITFAIWTSLFISCLGMSSSAMAQELVPVIGTDYYCIHFPDGSVTLGEANGNDIAGVSFEEAIEGQRKKVLRSKARLKVLNKLLKNKKINKADRNILKGIITSKNAQRRSKVRAKIRKERSNVRFLQSRLDQLFSCEAGERFQMLGDVDLVYFSEAVVDPLTGADKVFSGYYISTTYPKKIKKNQKFLAFSFCTQYYSPDTFINAVGHRSPSEAKVTFTNNLCDHPRTPEALRGANCIGIMPDKTVGVLLVGRYTDVELSAESVEFITNTVSSVSHYVQPVSKKTGCRGDG